MHQDEPPAKVTPRKRKKTWHITEPVRKKAKKAGPKRPLSAFMFFSQTRRKELKVQHPDMDFGEIGRQVGAMWQELSVEERKVYLFFRSPVFFDNEIKPYAIAAERDKVRYELEKRALSVKSEE